MFLPLYDLQDNEILMCISLFIKHMVPASNNGKLAQYGRKFHGSCKEEIPEYPCIIELKAACSFWSSLGIVLHSWSLHNHYDCQKGESVNCCCHRRSQGIWCWGAWMKHGSVTSVWKCMLCMLACGAPHWLLSPCLFPFFMMSFMTSRHWLIWFARLRIWTALGVPCLLPHASYVTSLNWYRVTALLKP